MSTTGLTVEKLRLAKKILQEADYRWELKIYNDHAEFKRTGVCPQHYTCVSMIAGDVQCLICMEVFT